MNQHPRLYLIFLFLSISLFGIAQRDSTYAERLGFPKDKKVVILHVDDAGMSFDSNNGVIDAITNGVASSCSVMMPCPWVPAIVHYLKDHPGIDAGLHLTLTSEWKEYRWVPLYSQGKGLKDAEGCLWPDVMDVVTHASPDEVEQEIRAQLARALAMGFRPTHLDSHMGTLFASPKFMERYLKVGMENKIPVMFPGGHNTLISRQMKGMGISMEQVRVIGKMLWDAGLPVLDDLHNESYDWKYTGSDTSQAAIQKAKTAYYEEAFKEIRPGVTMVIMHCTRPTVVFAHITGSGITREGDLLAMINPELKAFIQKEGIIITTWRELMERRTRLK